MATTLFVMDEIKTQIHRAIADHRNRGSDLDRDWLTSANRKLKTMQRKHQRLQLDLRGARDAEKAERIARSDAESKAQKQGFEAEFRSVCRQTLGDEAYFLMCNTANQRLAARV